MWWEFPPWKKKTLWSMKFLTWKKKETIKSHSGSQTSVEIFHRQRWKFTLDGSIFYNRDFAPDFAPPFSNFEYADTIGIPKKINYYLGQSIIKCINPQTWMIDQAILGARIPLDAELNRRPRKSRPFSGKKWYSLSMVGGCVSPHIWKICSSKWESFPK